jgi:hypothetical protein
MPPSLCGACTNLSDCSDPWAIYDVATRYDRYPGVQPEVARRVITAIRKLRNDPSDAEFCLPFLEPYMEPEYLAEVGLMELAALNCYANSLYRSHYQWILH